MPSWNIHSAHVERLLNEQGARVLGIDDVNSFLVGNYVPDVPLGYMVPDPTHKLRYGLTHVAHPCAIPIPRAWQFWNEYVAQGNATSLELGVWAHLVCDRAYNKATRAWLERYGIPTGERTRIRKQGDFALFGKTFPLTLHPQVTPELLDECARFTQYKLYEADIRKAVDVACDIIDENGVGAQETPAYSMLTEEFFSEVFEAAHTRLVDGLIKQAKLR